MEIVPNAWYSFEMGQHSLSKEKIVKTLLSEFRKCGFAGLSLSHISDVTGLGKASLYHYFPGGKDEMAFEVMKMTNSWVENEIVSVLTSQDDPKNRLKLVLKRLDEFYESGCGACLLEMMGGEESPVALHSIIRDTFNTLLGGFQKLAMDSGKSTSESKALAEKIVVGIQGSLILSRALKDPGPFQRLLKVIRSSILNGPRRRAT